MTGSRYEVRIAPEGSVHDDIILRSTSQVNAQREINWTLKHRGGSAQITDRRDGSVRDFTHDGATLTPVQS